MSTLTPSSQHTFGSLSHNNQRRERNKKFKIKRDKVKIVIICSWHEVSTQMLLELIKEFSKSPVFLSGESQGQRSLVGCRLWGHTELDTTKVMQQQQQNIRLIHRNIAFIYTNNKISERDNHWILSPGPGQGAESNYPCPCSLPSDFLESGSSLLWLYPAVFYLGLMHSYSYFWKFLPLHLATNFESFPKGGLLYIQG